MAGFRSPPTSCPADDPERRRGARAHYIQLLGFASVVTNMLVVQVFITGMHSYAGVG
jgi:hypothetical protein